MPSRYPYWQTIHNEYLGVSKTIRAMSRNELDWLVQSQYSKWAEQESRKRQAQKKNSERDAARQDAENLRSQAAENTASAQERIEAFRTILISGLGREPCLDWDELIDRTLFRPFACDQTKPDRDLIRFQLLGPEPAAREIRHPTLEKPSALEFFLPFLRKRRDARNRMVVAIFEDGVAKAHAEKLHRMQEYRSRESEVVRAYNSAAAEYNRALTEQHAQYVRDRDAFLAEQHANNVDAMELRSRYENGMPDAIARYVRLVLERSLLADLIGGEFKTGFDDASKTLVLSIRLPMPDEVPSITEHKHVVSRKEIVSVRMKQKEFDSFYDNVIHQIALRTIHEVFSADYPATVESVVFNGWVRGIDRKTGKYFDSYILSCAFPKKSFAEFDLSQVSPKDCIRGLKGITAGPLAMLAPVEPIMELDTDDDRFVESKDVLDGLRPEDNLAAMDWEDFEHLVRELFELEFSKTGGEVRITQASRDRGVDAIAFDHDPIRGGKFVIQAKKYNEVVPVSAVRDLYGTMIAEDAVRGILVTTSHYGRDSIEFAAGKRITLINGEHLVYLFQKHGRNLYISLLPKGDPRRGLGAG